MKHFRDAVRRHMEREGWHVYPVTFRNRPIVNLLCWRNGKVKLIRTKAHEHIYQKERKALRKLGREFEVHILYAYEAQGHELVFKRIYP